MIAYISAIKDMEPVRIILILLFPHMYTCIHAFESKTRVDSIVTINNATGDRRSREAEKDGERKRENRNGRVADDWKTGSSCAGKDVAEQSRMSQFRVGRCTRLGSAQQRSFDFAHPGYVIRCSGNGISWFVEPLSRWILNSFNESKCDSFSLCDDFLSKFNRDFDSETRCFYPSIGRG